MTDQPALPVDAATDIDEAANAGLVQQLSMMVSALFASPVRNTLIILGLGLITVVLLTAVGQIRLNSWNQPFYDALARRNFPDFIVQLGVFAIIAGCLLVLNVFQTWLHQMTKLKLREGLVLDLIGQWLVPMR